MALLRQFYTNFIAGEITPLLSSRVDTDAYKNGVKSMENFRILSQGGVKRRGGFRFQKDLGTSNYQMETFVFDEDEAYVVLFYAGTGINNGYIKFINVGTGLTETTIGSQVWQQTHIGEIKVAQSLDTMIIVHPDFVTQKVLRTGANSFTVSNFVFDTSDTGEIFQPYHRFADPAITLTPQNTGTASQTITASSAFFQGSNHNSTVIEYTDTAGNIRYFTINTVVTNTTATGSFNVGPANTSAVSTWKEQVFGPLHGHPRSVIFHDQRLIFGGSRGLPNFLFMSKVGEFFNFDVGTGLDNESIQVQIAENQVSEIKSLNSFRHLSIFTSEKELFVPTVDDRPLTPSTISIKTQTSFGSSEVPSVEFDGAVVFLTATKGAIREFIYSDINQAYNSDALTLLSPHLIGTTIDMAAQREATDQVESYLYTINEAGDMPVFMSLRKERVQGWSQFKTTGSFEQIAVVNRKLYAIVNRTINGNSRKILERLDNTFNTDCARQLTSLSPSTNWTHSILPNTEVSVLSGNYSFGTFTTDSNGSITLPEAVSSVEIGIPYTTNLETLPPEFQLQDGISVGQKRRVVRAVLDLNETLNVQTQGTNVLIRSVGDDFSVQPTPVTARKELYFLGWGNEGTITITQDETLPITINGIMLEVEV